MAILRIHTYNIEKAFYENKLVLVNQELEVLKSAKAKLQDDNAISKKERSIFLLKYNTSMLLLGMISSFLEGTLPGSMIITFVVQNTLEQEMPNLEGIKHYYDMLDDNLNEMPTIVQINAELDLKNNKKYYLQNKLYMLELIKNEYLKFELKDGRMVVNVPSYPIYCTYLVFKELFDKEVFLPDYYKDKKINIKTLQKQIKIK